MNNIIFLLFKLQWKAYVNTKLIESKLYFWMEPSIQTLRFPITAEFSRLEEKRSGGTQYFV